MLRALIFDFDGLILDTETPLLQSWREVFTTLGVTIDHASLARLVEHHRDPAEAYDLLESRLGRALDRDALRAARLGREARLMARRRALPGVNDLLGAARSTGIRTAIASSSPLSWIAPQLQRLGLASSFDSIRSRDDVERTKPDPQLYVAVLADLGLKGGEAVAFEDAPAGVEAARRAGVFCVAVPNPATAGLSWGPVDLTVPSLPGISLRQLDTLLARRITQQAHP